MDASSSATRRRSRVFVSFRPLASRARGLLLISDVVEPALRSLTSPSTTSPPAASSSSSTTTLCRRRHATSASSQRASTASDTRAARSTASSPAYVPLSSPTSSYRASCERTDGCAPGPVCYSSCFRAATSHDTTAPVESRFTARSSRVRGAFRSSRATHRELPTDLRYYACVCAWVGRRGAAWVFQTRTLSSGTASLACSPWRTQAQTPTAPRCVPPSLLLRI